MSSNAELGWSVRDAEVLKSMQRIQADNEKMKQQLADITTKSKQAGDAWTSGLRAVSAEQQRIAQGQNAWEQGLSSIGGRYRSLREQMLDTSQKAKGASETWVAGLRSISEQQRPLLDTNRRWQEGLERIAAANKAAAAESKQAAQGIIQSMTSSNRAAGELSDTVLGVGTNLGTITLAMSGLALGVSIVEHEYSAWKQTISELGQEHARVARELATTLVTTGAGMRGAELEQALGQIPGVTPQQAAATYEAIRAASPGLSQERSVALTQTAAQEAVTGIAPDRLRDFSAAVGELADKFPEKSPEALADLATVLREQAGGKFAEVTSDRFQRTIGEMKAAGMSGEQALGLLVAGGRAEIDPRTMESVALALASKEGPGRVRSPEDALKNEFQRTAPGLARLSMLQQRPDVARAVLGPGYDTKLAQISVDDISQVTSALEFSQGAFGRSLMPSSEAGSRAAAAQFVQSLKTQGVSGERGRIGETRGLLEEFYKARGMSETQLHGVQLPWIIPDIPGRMGVYDTLVGKKGFSDTQAALGMLRADLESAQTAERAGTLPAAGREHIVALRQMISVLERIEQNQQQRPALNVNGHVEKKE